MLNLIFPNFSSCHCSLLISVLSFPPHISPVGKFTYCRYPITITLTCNSAHFLCTFPIPSSPLCTDSSFPLHSPLFFALVLFLLFPSFAGPHAFLPFLLLPFILPPFPFPFFQSPFSPTLLSYSFSFPTLSHSPQFSISTCTYSFFLPPAVIFPFCSAHISFYFTDLPYFTTLLPISHCHLCMI